MDSCTHSSAAQTSSLRGLNGALDVQLWQELLQSTSKVIHHTDSASASVFGATSKGLSPRFGGAGTSHASRSLGIVLVSSPAEANVADLPSRH